jgi:hypothetical protein
MAKALTVKRIEKLLRVPGKYTDGDVRGLMLCVESKRLLAPALATQPQDPPHGAGLGSEGPD